MSDHYRSIGFPAPDAPALVQLLRRSVAAGVRTPQPDGREVVRWQDEQSGAGIIVVLDAGGMIRSAKPTFVPAVRRTIRARVHGLQPDSANPDADMVKITPRGGELPWSVQFEHGATAVAGLTFGEETDLEVVGFADRLDCFEDEGAFAASGVPLGTREVVPPGLLALNTGLRSSRRDQISALASGVVMSAEELHNHLSGEPFLHFVLDTTPVPLDVVVAPREIRGPSPRRGHVVTGALWLVARQTVRTAAPPRAVCGEAGTVPPRVAGAAASPVAGRLDRPRLFSRWC